MLKWQLSYVVLITGINVSIISLDLPKAGNERNAAIYWDFFSNRIMKFFNFLFSIIIAWLHCAIDFNNTKGLITKVVVLKWNHSVYHGVCSKYRGNAYSQKSAVPAKGGMAQVAQWQIRTRFRRLRLAPLSFFTLLIAITPWHRDRRSVQCYSEFLTSVESAAYRVGIASATDTKQWLRLAMRNLPICESEPDSLQAASLHSISSC